MELIQILKVIWRRWWLIAIPTVIVGVWVLPDLLPGSSATSGGFTTTFRYTAGQERAAFEPLDGDLQDVWEASYKLIDAFTTWVQTGEFREAVAEIAAENGVEIAPSAFSIFADNERAIGQITVQSADAEQLQIVAEAVVVALQTHNADAFGPQLGGEPAQVILLDEIAVSPAPPPLTSRFGPLVRLALALAIGIGLAFFVDYLDDTVRERNDLARLGLSPLATIPRR